MRQKTIRYLDLFSGIGGFREGLTQAGGFTCAGHCEIDQHADRSYRALFDTEGEWFCDDIRKADPEELPDVELLCGGFPCQAFSIAGNRGGFDDPRGTLFFEIARLTAAKRPAYLLLENVPGLLNHDGGRTFAAILHELDGLGYFVEWQVLNLMSKGHKTVYHIAGPSTSRAAESRARGWREALEQMGARVPSMYIGDWCADSGYQAGVALAHDPDCTAIYAANDQMAYGAMLGLQSAGKRVPEDVSIVGVDDSLVDMVPRLNLTTMKLRFDDIGATAFSMVRRQCEGSKRWT